MPGIHLGPDPFHDTETLVPQQQGTGDLPTDNDEACDFQEGEHEEQQREERNAQVVTDRFDVSLPAGNRRWP
jgi:hypothetical protein